MGRAVQFGTAVPGIHGTHTKQTLVEVTHKYGQNFPDRIFIAKFIAQTRVIDTAHKKDNRFAKKLSHGRGTDSNHGAPSPVSKKYTSGQAMGRRAAHDGI
jgi:hypothetical protein